MLDILWTGLKRWFEPRPLKPRTLEDVKKDGILSVDRDWAVAQNMNFIQNLIRPGNAKELQMAKRKTVSFKVRDGFKPRRSSGPGRPFELLSPIPIHMKAGTGSVAISLGLSCMLPVVVQSTYDKETKVFGPWEIITVHVDADKDVVNIGPGEVVALAWVIDNTDIEIED